MQEFLWRGAALDAEQEVARHGALDWQVSGLSTQQITRSISRDRKHERFVRPAANVVTASSLGPLAQSVRAAATVAPVTSVLGMLPPVLR
jgi:hypothetical protein